MSDVFDFKNQVKADAKVTLTGMLTQLGINVAITIGVAFAFSILRPHNSNVYARTIKYSAESKRPPKLGQGLLDWLAIIRLTDEQLLEKIGYDALVFIQFVRLLLRMFFYMTVVGILVIIPVNIVGTLRSNDGDAPGGEIRLLSVADLDNDDRWYWAHVGVTWIFSTLIYYMLFSQYKSVVALRRKYFESEEYRRSIHSHTVMVLNVPHLKSDSDLAELVRRMNPPYPVQQAYMGRKVGKLPELIEKHEEAVRNLESQLAKYLKGPNKFAKKRPTCKVNGRCCGGVKVDGIDHYTKEMQELEREIETARDSISENKMTNYGFVSFASMPQAHAVAKRLESSLPIKLNSANPPQFFLAPTPKDIIWKNVSLNPHARRTKRWIGNIFFIAFCFVWIFPMLAISALAHVKVIKDRIPALKPFFKKNPFIESVIEASLAPLLMAIFLLLLPLFLRFLSRQQGALTKTSCNYDVLRKLYTFFIVSNLIYVTLFQTFLDIYATIRDKVNNNEFQAGTLIDIFRESKILDDTAKSLTKVSSFWINYISLRGLSVVLDLMQVFALVIIWLKKRLTNPTPRELREATRPLYFDYPMYYNLSLFYMTIGLLYSVIAPLVLPFCVAYFSLNYIVQRYQVLYVCQTKIETGGAMWRVIFNRFLMSIILFQLVMIGLMNLKGASLQSLVLAPLPILTILLKLICWRTFDSKCKYYSGSGDLMDGSGAHMDMGSTKNKDKLYRRFGHPALSTDLPTPMVHSNVNHMLSQVYSGRLDEKTEKRQTGISRLPTTRRLTLLKNGSQTMRFQTVDTSELAYDDSRDGINGYYKDDDDYSEWNEGKSVAPSVYSMGRQVPANDLYRNEFEPRRGPPLPMNPQQGVEAYEMSSYPINPSSDAISYYYEDRDDVRLVERSGTSEYFNHHNHSQSTMRNYDNLPVRQYTTDGYSDMSHQYGSNASAQAAMDYGYETSPQEHDRAYAALMARQQYQHQQYPPRNERGGYEDGSSYYHHPNTRRF
ncbi:uncharacterized protein VTP21DRAFT_5892 [Calcarisporiella thermophila]|uniref:uncharacterized protein n=1 Tax=Calcarisporiella thermophila TaxID=911321 RepID=UPI0037428102